MAEVEKVDLQPKENVDQRSNVVLVEGNETAFPRILPSTLMGRVSNEGDEATALQELAHRWVYVETLKWSTNQEVGAKLLGATFPNYVFTKAARDNAAFCPLKGWTYYRADMVLKFQVNATKFHVGQLQCAYLYQGEAMEDKRENIFLSSQKPHAIINAQANNLVEMVIPFRNYRSYLVRGHKEGNDVLLNDLAYVTVMVLSRLTTTSTTYGTVNVNVFFRLENFQFQGMNCPNIIAEHQMWSFLGRLGVSAAEGALEGVVKDLNRDNPSAPVPSAVVVPRSGNSWSLGTNIVELNNILRLDAIGTTPALDQIDEMSARKIARIPGLVHRFAWSMSQTTGSLLWCSPVRPLHEPEQYNMIKAPTMNLRAATYAVPPIGVMASLFEYWHGGIEYRFDIVSSVFHTGRIQVVFCPGMFRRSPTFEEAQSCYTAVFDLEEVKSFRFVAPFVADRDWWPVSQAREGKLGGLATGYVCVYVLNQLVPTDNIPQTVDVLCYVSGGDDIEFAVPCAPRLGLGCHNWLYPVSRTHLRSGYDQVYTSTWRFFGDSKKVILRYGNVTDHVSQGENVVKDVIYQSPIAIDCPGGEACKYIVFWPQEPYYYPVPFRDIEKAKEFIISEYNYYYAIDFVKEGNWVDLRSRILEALWSPTDRVKPPKVPNARLPNEPHIYVLTAGAQGKNKYCYVRYDDSVQEVGVQDADEWGAYKLVPPFVSSDGAKLENYVYYVWAPTKDSTRQLVWCQDAKTAWQFSKSRDWSLPGQTAAFRSASAKGNYLVPVERKEMEDDFAIIDNDVEHQTIAEPGTRVLRSAQEHFGEGFDDLKTLCRRYQLYAQVVLPLKGRVTSGTFLISIPVVPGGLRLPNHGHPERETAAMHFAREGVIPLVGNGFRYFRGGMRFKLVFNSNIKDLVIFVSHFPKSHSVSNRIHGDIKYDGDVNLRSDSFCVTGHAGHAQAIRMNQVIEVEVPYYLGTDYGLNHHCHHRVNNDLVATSSNLGSIRIGLLNHLEEVDGRLSVQAYYSFADDMRFSAFHGFGDMLFTDTIRVPKQPAIEHQSLIGELFGVGEFERSISYGTLRAGAIAEHFITTLGTQGEELIEKLRSTLVDCLGLTIDAAKQTIIACMSSLAHLINCPKWSTAIIVAVTLIAQFGLIKAEDVGRVSSVMTQYLPFYSSERMQNDVEHQSDSDDAVFMSTCIAAVAAVGSFVVPRSWKTPDFRSELLKDLRDFSLTANSLNVFFRNNINFFRRIVNWLRAKMFGSDIIFRDLMEEDEEVRQWVEEVAKIVDPVMRGYVKKEVQLQQRVFVLAAVGKQLLIRVASASRNDRALDLLKIYGQKIAALQEELNNECLTPAARFEPWVLNIAGASNIGKSYYLQKVGIALLDSVNYRTTCDPVFTRTPGVQYWNGIGNQPIILYDDFLAVGGDNGLQQANELFCLKSCSVFNPSIAELENKRRRINPVLVLLASNQEYFSVPNITTPQALNRRRDNLWVMKLRDEYRTLRDVPNEVKAVNGHLLFSRRADPANEESYLDIEDIGYDDFLTHVKRDFKEYYMLELGRYHSRLDELQTLFPEAETSTIGELRQRFEELVGLSMLDGADTLRWAHGVREFNAVENFPHESRAHVEHQGRSSRSNGRDVCDCPHIRLENDDSISFWREPGDKYGRFTSIENDELDFSDEPCQSELCALRQPGRLEAIIREYKRINRITLLDVRMFDARRVPGFVLDTLPHYPQRTQSKSRLIEISELVRKRYNEITSSSKLQQMWISLKSVARWVGLAAGVVSSILFIKQYTSRGKCREEYIELDDIGERVEAQISASADERTVGSKRAVAKESLRKQIERIKFAEPQSVSGNDNVLNTILHNCGSVTFVDEDHGYITSSHFVGLVDHWILTMKHMWESMRGRDGKLTLLFRGAQIPIDRSGCLIRSSPESSVCLIWLPNVAPFRDIRKHIATANDHGVVNRECILAENNSFVSLHHMYTDYREGLEIGPTKDAKGSIECEGQRLIGVYSYPLSRRGLCGSLLFATVPRTMVIGMHVAGEKQGSFGYAQPIFYEFFSDLSHRPRCDPEVGHQNFSRSAVDIRSCVIPDRIMPRQLCVNTAQKSRIVPSLAFDRIVEHTTEPAPLDKNDERVKGLFDPMTEGVNKFGTPPDIMDDETLQRCIDDLREKILATCPPVLMHAEELLTDDQIFGGIAGVKEYNGLRLNTSEGMPLILERPRNAHDKRWLFEYYESSEGNRLISIHPSLKALMSFNHNKRLCGEIPWTVFTNIMKDCRIAREKVKKPGATRLFSVSPVEYTWACKRYFSHFQAAYQRGRIRNECAIGINTHGPEWGQLARWLCSVGTKLVTGDYSAFGDRLSYQAMAGAAEIIIAWYERFYSRCHSNYRRILFEEGFSAPRMAKNLIYRVVCGIPSGHALTVEINSLVNCLYMRYCWLKCTEGSNYATMQHFNRLVRLVTYGDDLIMSVAPAVGDLYNFIRIREVLAAIDISFTPSDKTSEGKEFECMAEVTFLKAKFRPHPYRPTEMLPDLPDASIYECVNWNWISPDMVSSFFEGARASCLAAFGRGEEFYMRWRKLLLDFCARDPRLRDYLHAPTWRELDMEMFSG
nr:MAG: polyprotein [Longquan rodent iflavirus 1]